MGDHCQRMQARGNKHDECCQKDAPSWNAEGRWIDSMAYKAADAANIAAGNGSRHPVLQSAVAAASKPSDSSRSGSKYGPGDNYKTVSFFYKDNRQHWS